MRTFHSFPLITGLTTVFILALCIASYFFLFTFNDKDVREYWDIMAESDPARVKNAAETPYTAKQSRLSVHKHMWVNSCEGPLEISVRSEEAELVLDRKEASTEIIENMHNVQCYMQEELFYALPDGSEAVRNESGDLVLRNSDTRILENAPTLVPMQIVRFIQADAASYSYKTDRLTAQDVAISRFSIPGHALTDSLDNITPLMTGVAESMECTLDGNDPQFKAHHFKAVLHHSGI